MWAVGQAGDFSFLDLGAAELALNRKLSFPVSGFFYAKVRKTTRLSETSPELFTQAGQFVHFRVLTPTEQIKHAK